MHFRRLKHGLTILATLFGIGESTACSGGVVERDRGKAKVRADGTVTAVTAKQNFQRLNFSFTEP
jgi:hypothetical protein